MPPRPLSSALAALALLAGCASAELVTIETDAQFEQDVIMAPYCIAVLFTSKTRDVVHATRVMEQLEAALPGLAIATADVDEVKAFASEFNVRKRMVPRILLFNSRARQAEVIRLPGEGAPDFAEVKGAASAALAENKARDAEGRYEKLTLAIGAGKPEL
jgi:hypothetical protein